MSITDPEAPDVQPEQGQGDQGQGDSPYADYLTRFEDDNARAIAAEAFKDFDGRTTQKFQEHAEFRKKYEPLEPTGISNLNPDQAAWLMQFWQILDDPQAVQQWFDGFAQQNGLTPQQQERAVEELGLDQFGVDPQQIDKLLDQRLSPLQQRLEQYEQRFAQQDQQAQMAQINQMIEGQHKALEQRFGDEYDREMAATFAERYADSHPEKCLELGFADWQKRVAAIQKQTLQSGADAPGPAEGGGVPDTSPPKVQTVMEAGPMAREWLRNNNRR